MVMAGPELGLLTGGKSYFLLQAVAPTKTIAAKSVIILFILFDCKID
jgi:hypothetical protein